MARLTVIAFILMALIIGLAGCEKDEVSPPDEQATPNEQPLVNDPVDDSVDVSADELTNDPTDNPTTENRDTQEQSLLYDLPLAVSLTPSANGFEFFIDEPYSPFLQLTLQMDGNDHITHVVRRMDSRQEWTLYRQDLVVVYPGAGRADVFPMTNAYITDEYSVDSLGYACRYADSEHLLCPSATGDVPGEQSAFQIIRIHVRTGEKEVLFDQHPKSVEPDFYALSRIASNGNGQRFVASSFTGGELWVYDLQQQTAKKHEAKYTGTWPLATLFPSPDGNLIWYAEGEELRLFDLDGNHLTVFTRPEGYGQYPPILWSTDGEYATYPYTFERTDKAVIESEEGGMRIAPEGILVFDRSGQQIQDLKVAEESNRHLEIMGWLPSNGLAILHVFELDRQSGQIPEKINSSYELVDVRTGVRTSLETVPISELKRPIPIKVPSPGYQAETELVILDPDLKQMWMSDRPVVLFHDLESPYMYWIAPDYRASESIVYRYSPEDSELKEARIDRIMRDTAIQGNWLAGHDGLTVYYMDLNPLFRD